MDVSATGLIAAASVAAPQSAGETTHAAEATESTPPATASHPRSGLGPAIAKLFGTSVPPEPIRLDVSYRILHKPDVIVTVFSDPKTGQEVAQFPPEILIGLAEFFDQPRGVTLDQDA